MQSLILQIIQRYGKSAGLKRNTEMAAYADALIAFWDGESKGTKHLIELVTQAELKVRVIYFKRILNLPIDMQVSQSLTVNRTDLG